MSKRLRSYVVAIMAMLFAFAIVAVPQKAWAVDGQTTEVTDFGTIGYFPDVNGFNLTVDIYVNDELADSRNLGKIADIGPIQDAGDVMVGDLEFNPGKGYNYFGGERSYSLDAHLENSAWWNQQTGNIEFGADEDAQKTWDNVLSIYLYTFTDRVSLDVGKRGRLAQGIYNPKVAVQGYNVSYSAYDPATGQNRQFSHVVTDTDTDYSFKNQFVPRNTDVTIEGICNSGLEVKEWYFLDPYSALFEYTGSEGNGNSSQVDVGLATKVAKGSSVIVNYTADGNNLWITLEAVHVGDASAPTPDEVRTQLGDAAVAVECVNGFATHDKVESALGDDGTFAISGVRKDGGKAYVDVTVTPDSYIKKLDDKTGSVHSLVDEDQDKAITFVHDGSEWVPVEESPLVLEVTCDAGPSAPTFDELQKLIDDVQVSCVNGEESHLPAYFSLIEGSYSDGSLTSNGDGSYAYTVTVNAEKYVKAYNDATEVSHTLKDPAANTATVTLTNSGEGWKVNGGTPIKFEAVCISAPTFDEISDAFNGALVTVKCVTENSSHQDQGKTKTYGAIPYGVEIGAVGADGTVLIEVTPGTYANKFSTEVGVGHWLEPLKQDPYSLMLRYENGEWTAQDGVAPIPVTVACPATPEVIPPLPETDDDFEALFPEGAIKVTCVKNADHDFKTYQPVIGNVTYIDHSRSDDGIYTVTMAIGYAHYVNLYSENIGKLHVLSEGQPETQTIQLTCKSGDKSWQVVDGSSVQVEFKVTCADDDPFQPGKPTVDDVEKLLAAQPVLLDCTTNVGHDDAQYSLIDGSYTIADVTGDSIVGYASSITIDATDYVAQYSKDKQIEHVLLDPTADSVTINLTYKGDTEGWQLVDDSQKQVTFEVKCEFTGPSLDELHELLDGNVNVYCSTERHESKSYALLDNSYKYDQDAVSYKDGKWTVDVTILPEEYVEEFEAAYSGIDHTLDPVDQSAGIVVTLEYDTVDHAWKISDNSTDLVNFKVACEPVGTITVTPVDMTIYQGATSGYEAVVGENGETAEMSENALPEPLFEVKSSTGDIPEGIKFYNNDNVWTLEDKGNGYYRFVNEGEGDPVRIQFTDADSGKTIVSSEFDPHYTRDSYRQLAISIYPGESGSSSATAMAGDAPYAVNTGTGTLTIRAVADDNAVDPIENDAPTSVELDAADAVAVEPENGTTYTLNNTGVELDSDAEPSLLFDSIIDDDEVNRTQLLENEIDAQPGIDSGFQSEIKYLDLVDASNGNAWIKSSNGVDIYWDYPKGTDQNTEFKVMHFSGLHRDGEKSGFEPGDIDGATIENVTFERTADGITFHVDEGNFSPYALVWDYEDNGGTTPGGDGGTTTKYYKIEASAGEGGSISPSGTVKVAAGTDETFTITADEGYAIGSVIVDGVNYRQISSYTFEDVDEDHTISVTFMRGNDPANPDDTGVSDWLETDDHIVFLNGYGDGSGTFGPENQMTRAEVAQMFYNLLLDKSRGDKPVSFTDVPADAYYAEPVFTLASLGIVNGTSPETFEPNRPITRAEFVAIAMRFTNGEFEGENLFVDVPEDAWYRDYVVGAVGYGWIYGYQDGSQKFGPLDSITRGQATMVTNRMLWRACDTVWAMEHMDQLKTFVDLGQSHYAFFDVVEATNAHDYTRVGDTRYENWTGLVK